jgi:hypothetical protein
VVAAGSVFVGASAFKYAKRLVAWNITKVSTGCGISRDQSCMKQMLGEYNNLNVWATLNSCDKNTLWNAWYDIEEGIGRPYVCVCVRGRHPPAHFASYRHLFIFPASNGVHLLPASSVPCFSFPCSSRSSDTPHTPHTLNTRFAHCATNATTTMASVS